MSTRKLTVVGLDAATFTVVDPLLAAGQLPNLARLLAGGSSGTLRSTTHPLTPQAWSTMVTGVNAGRHGIWDFAERDETGYGLRLVNGSYRRAPALWDHLTAAGKRVGLVNIPFTWPAPAVNGFAIAGFDAANLEQGMIHPAPLLGELRERFGNFKLDHEFPLDGAGKVDLGRVRREAEQKVEIALWLAERFEPDLLFTVFMAGDHVQHLGWQEWEREGPDSAVGETYRILDECLGAIVDAAPSGADTLVVSDHGAGRLDGVVNLNAWLEQHGYLVYAGSVEQRRRRVANTVFGLRRFLPEGLRYRMKQRLPDVRRRARELEEYTLVDWEQTRAFAYGIFGNVVVNVRGREEHGTVEPGLQYERLRDELSAGLGALAGPDGRPIVTAVHRREDLFWGDAIDRVPDLLVEFAGDYAWLGKGTLKTRPTSLWDRVEIAEGSAHSYVGSHRSDGLIALAGPSVAGREERLAARIEDVAPTILYLLGQPIPTDLEGRVLVEAVAPELLDEQPPEYREAVGVALDGRGDAPSEGAEVENRLRGLGYIE